MSDNPFVQEPEQTAPVLFLARVGSVTGGLFLRFEGEETVRQKSTKRLASYTTPAMGDRVLVVEVGGSDIVIGKVI